MKKRMIVFCVIGFVLLATYLYAQNDTFGIHDLGSTKSWLLWKINDGNILGSDKYYPTVKLWKVQDGACSLYVAEGGYGPNKSVSVTTGQGCK